MRRGRAVLLVGMCTSLLSCGRLDGILGAGSTTLASCRLATPYQFRLTALDSLGDSSFVAAMNAAGDIAGLSYRADGVHGMLWTASGTGNRDLGAFRPIAMNLNRDLLGTAPFDSRANVPAFLPNGGAAQEIVAPSGSSGFSVNDVNDNGDVLISGNFFSDTSPGHSKLFVWKNGSATLLQDVTGYLVASGLRYTTDGFVLYHYGSSPAGIVLMSPATGQVLASGNWERAQISSAKDLVAVSNAGSVLSGPPGGSLLPHGAAVVALSHFPSDVNASLHMLSAPTLGEYYDGRFKSFAIGTVATALDSSLATQGWSIRSTRRLNDADQIAAVGLRTSAPSRPVAVRLDKTSCP